MHASLELLLEFFKLGSHPLADRLALHHKVPVPVLPADVRESQKIERFGFPFSSLYPVQLGKSPELNPARFVWVQFQPELSQPFPEIDQETVCVGPILEAEYVVVGISHHYNVASRALLAPDIYPEVEYVMQIDIGEHRRNHRALRSTYLGILPFAFLHYSGIQPFLDQPEDTDVGNAMLEKLEQPFSRQVVEGNHHTLPIISTSPNA
jgi:hypothetical protein